LFFGDAVGGVEDHYNLTLVLVVEADNPEQEHSYDDTIFQTNYC